MLRYISSSQSGDHHVTLHITSRRTRFVFVVFGVRAEGSSHKVGIRRAMVAYDEDEVRLQAYWKVGRGKNVGEQGGGPDHHAYHSVSQPPNTPPPLESLGFQVSGISIIRV